MDLDKICRLCLSTKKDMRNIFSDNIISMLEEFAGSIKITKEQNGWPNKICTQCVNQVSRCHSFKKRIEKADEQLKSYIKSLTIIVEEPVSKPDLSQPPPPPMKEIQIQRSEPPQIQQSAPLIITNINPTAMLNGQQLIQTANGQFIQAQFVPSSNTIQMITTNPAPPPQLLQIRPEPTELIVQQQTAPERSYQEQYYEEIPVVVQSANGQQTILNLPHHQVQQLQQQVQQQQQQQQIQQIPGPTTSSSETDEIEIHEVQNYDDDEYVCDELEEIIEEEMEQEIENNNQQASSSTSMYFITETDTDDVVDKDLYAEFLSQHTVQEGSKFTCNLCHNEFKNMKILESHMKSVHANWIKANCKKQPKCQICGKTFRGPGMLRMHFKTHERENKMPTCSVCGKEFKSKSILYRHRATHFAGQHNCTICNKTFNSNYQLNAHLARHQKNHQCNECEKCFANTTDLKNHLQSEHKTDGKKTTLKVVKITDVVYNK